MPTGTSRNRLFQIGTALCGKVLLGGAALPALNLLHEFVLMPDHFHLLVSPTLSLERSLQLIMGGFSYRAKKELGFAGEIWEKSLYDRRVRRPEDYYNFKQYIRQIQSSRVWLLDLRIIPTVQRGQNSLWTMYLGG